MSSESSELPAPNRLADIVLRGREPAPPAFITRQTYYPWLVVGVTCVAAFIGQLDASIVQLTLPTLEREFDANRELGGSSVPRRFRFGFANVWPPR
jgi:hypothetical protein